ncbi:TVP38/TMEM64 family protein [Alkaliphilus serpentinus]|uniref:TVP38/TMEM64 family membrane protein n=1 Tax=Alkaliphilus serpentinus TaxID=1482731 RepID=A0A833HR50_9FIRM|nr:VTT domain-containing protein [Alkaliphilus serpentinus]KAB3532855.1 VTT domain-containing protein [Alkaliphilus serpentinus]
MKRRQVRKKLMILIVIIIIVIAVALWKYPLWNLLSIIEYLKKFTTTVRNLGYLGLLLYLVAFTLGTMLFLPSLPFALFGGITYGSTLGIIYASIGDILGASLAFVIGRYFMRERIERVLQKYKTFHEINEGVKHDGWRIIVLTRMVPLIPHWLQNYAYGLTSVGFLTYALVSLLCIAPTTAVWIIVVNTLGRGEKDANKIIFYLAIAAVVIVLLSYIPKWIYKKKMLAKEK